MGRALKGDQGLIEPVGLPICLRLAPVSRVSGEPKHNFVAADVLRALIRKASALGPWRANERQTNRLVIRFVRSIFTVCQYGYAECSILVCQIDPLMRSNLKLALGLVWPLNRANIPIVSCQIVCWADRKRSLKICFFGLPIDDVTELDPITGIACGETDSLRELGAFSLAQDFDRNAYRAALDHVNLCGTFHKIARV